MSLVNRIKYLVICLLVLSAGFGLALLLPWLAGIHGLAVTQGALAAGLCYATPDDGTTVFNTVDASAVQQAVDAAVLGAVVKVAGTCVGVGTRAGLDMTVYISKSLTLQGGYLSFDWSLDSDPSKFTTTLDANLAGRVVVISDTTDVTLDGLFLTGGSASDGALLNRGGGIWSNSSVTLKNSIVFSNTAAWGGGISFDQNTSPILEEVTIQENKAKIAGGLDIGANSSPVLRDVRLMDNFAVNSGGGMYNFVDSNPVLYDVTFIRNSAQTGGGMYNNNDSILRMNNVVFAGNSASMQGGGINNDIGSRIEINNAVFSGNTAEEGAGMFNSENENLINNASFSGNSASMQGGGIYNEDADTKVNNSIVWNNRSGGITGDIDSAIVNDPSSVTTLTYSLVQGSGGSASWLLGAGFADGTGNIDTDPLFITQLDPASAPATAGDLDLDSNSPAVDAGRNSLTSVLYDIKNKERIVDGDKNGTATVDMGAYELYPYGIYIPMIISTTDLPF